LFNVIFQYQILNIYSAVIFVISYCAVRK